MQRHKFFPTHLPQTLAARQKGLILQDLLQLPSCMAPWLETQQKSKPSIPIRSKPSEESFRSGKSDPTAKPVPRQAADCRGNPAPSITLSYSRAPACPVAKVARCKARGKEQNISFSSHLPSIM